MLKETFFCAAVILGAAVVLWIVTALIGMVLYQSGGTEREYIVIPVKGHREDIEFVIRRAVASRQRGTVVIVADFGTDAETASIARRLCDECERVEWVRGEAVEQCLRQHINTR